MCGCVIGNTTVLTWRRELVTGDEFDCDILMDGPNDMIYAWQDGSPGLNKYHGDNHNHIMVDLRVANGIPDTTFGESALLTVLVTSLKREHPVLKFLRAGRLFASRRGGVGQAESRAHQGQLLWHALHPPDRRRRQSCHGRLPVRAPWQTCPRIATVAGFATPHAAQQLHLHQTPLNLNHLNPFKSTKTETSTPSQIRKRCRHRGRGAVDGPPAAAAVGPRAQRREPERRAQVQPAPRYHAADGPRV